MERFHDVGVIFDMDGVLVDSAKPHLASWRQLAEEHGRTVTQAQFAATFGRANRDIIPLLFGESSPERVTLLAARKEEVYRELVRKKPPIVEGATELIEELDEKGVRLAVGSSAPQANIRLILDAMCVTQRITAIVSGDDVTRGKPDPEVFLAACRKLSLPPARCVVIEDAPVGIEAARRAGTKAIAVLMYHSKEAFGGADLVVKRLADLRADRVIELLNSVPPAR